MNRVAARIAAVTSVVALLVGGGFWAMPAAGADTRFLDPEQAFALSGFVRDGSTIELRFDVAPGYYLYRRAFAFSANGAALGVARIPPGELKFDETFQKKLQIHRGTLRIELPVTEAAGAFTVSVDAQGCADAGLCYAPMTRSATADLKALRSGAKLRFN